MPRPYLVSENRGYCRTRSCFPSTCTHLSRFLSFRLSAQFLFSTCTHISLFLRVCSVSVQHAHTNLSPRLLSFCSLRAHTSLSLSLSLCICSVSVQHVHTHLSLSPRLLSFCSARAHKSLSASAQFLFIARTHLSLSLCICSVSVHRAHTHLSLSLWASAQFLFIVQQSRAELNSVKHKYYVVCFSNFTCKYSQNHSTAIVIILWVFYLIRQRLDYNHFCAD